MDFSKIEVFKDMGQYVLWKTVESRNGHVFVKMKKITRHESAAL